MKGAKKLAFYHLFNFHWKNKKTGCRFPGSSSARGRLPVYVGSIFSKTISSASFILLVFLKSGVYFRPFRGIIVSSSIQDSCMCIVCVFPEFCCKYYLHIVRLSACCCSVVNSTVWFSLYVLTLAFYLYSKGISRGIAVL